MKIFKLFYLFRNCSYPIVLIYGKTISFVGRLAEKSTSKRSVLYIYEHCEAYFSAKMAQKWRFPKTGGAVTLFLLLATLAGCYRAPINQGNVLDVNFAQSFRIGMTKKQVETVLGKPVLINVFNAYDEWHYVYNVTDQKHKMTKRVWVFRFKNGRLIHYYRSHNLRT